MVETGLSTAAARCSLMVRRNLKFLFWGHFSQIYCSLHHTYVSRCYTRLVISSTGYLGTRAKWVLIGC